MPWWELFINYYLTLPLNQIFNKPCQTLCLSTIKTDVNPLRQSSRIAQRRAKSKELTKSTTNSVTNKTEEIITQIDDDPAVNNLKGSASTPTFTPTSTTSSTLSSAPPFLGQNNQQNFR